ncbi:MAG: PAS domain-containing protein [Bacteroidales bacterium]|nr:PAS domain-containing protein [Bacteroidales bacterium]
MEEEKVQQIKILQELVANYENMLSSIVSNLFFPSYITNAEGRFLVCNELFSKSVGRSIYEIIGHTFYELFSDSVAQNISEQEKQVFLNKRAFSFQTQRNGQWYLSSKLPLLSAKNEVNAVLTIERSLNENIDLFNSLREERDLLRTLMENTHDYIYFKDIRHAYTRVNKAMLHLLNIDDEIQAVGETDEHYFDKEFAQSRRKYEKEVIESGNPLLNIEEKLVKNGQEIWLSSNFSPIFNEKKQITGIVGFSRDISKLKYLIHELDTESAFLRLIMDNIPYTIYFKDTDGRFTKINKAQAELLGIDEPEKAIGKTDFDFFDATTAEMTRQDELRIMKQGVPLFEKIEQLTDSRGNKRWMSATKIPIKDEHGNIKGLVGISIDITERRKVEEKLREAKEKAEAADRLKTAFLANMSHEIRTPMNGIIGFSNLLRTPNLSEEERNEYLDHITSCGNTLLNLIDDIIDIAKIEAGQLKLRFAECNLNSIMVELYDTFKTIMKKENKDMIELNLSQSLPDHQAFIYTDPIRLKQILSNLLSNAVKFTLHGSIHFGYKIDEKHQLLFWVKDTGIGIPADKISIIFERFGQIADSQHINKKGTGLGLTISHNLAKMLGGDLWVDSEPNKGSTFYFTLPYQMIEAGTEQNNASINTDEELHKFLKDKTILIAEDEDYNFLYFKYLLKELQPNILWAKTGIEALEMVKQNPDICLVLMDCKMPVMNGFEATKEIKKLMPRLPVIMQTAYTSGDEQEKAKEVGCDAFITKPIVRKSLFQNIKNLLLHK